MTKLANILAAGAGVLALTTAGAAFADISIYTFGTGNSAISAYPGPYGQVDVNLTSPTTATVTFTAYDQGIYDYSFIDTGAVDVNVDATSWTITDLTTNALNAGTLSDDGSKNVDGFGVFNQTTKQTDGFADYATTISFVLTDTSGTWGSSSSVLDANSQGETLGAHIAVCDISTNPDCTSAIGALATGFGANGGPSVPEPATWAMMLAGFFGLGGLMRSRRATPTVQVA